MLFKKKKRKNVTNEKKIDKSEEKFFNQGISTVRDLIAPSAVDIEASYIQIGGSLAKTIYVITYPRFLNNNWFSPIINIDFPMDVAMFIHPADTAMVLRKLRASATHIQSRMNLEAESGKIRDPLLEAAMDNVEDLRDKLQMGTERFFRFGLYLTFYAEDKEQLRKYTNEVTAMLESQLVYTKTSILRMEHGFMSTLPLAEDKLNAGTNLNTAPLSTMFPFVSADLSSNEGLLYGINRHNNSLILFDRFNMENANMVIFAKSGSGKSYFVKLEILRSMMFGTNIIVIDPESEYEHLCQSVSGTFVHISLGSDAHINPFEIPRISKDSRTEDVFRNTVAGIIGLLHIMLGSVTAEEDTVLENAIRETYAVRDISETTDFSQKTHSDYPTLNDLQEVLANMTGAESLAMRLQKYTEGVFSGFLNNYTNIQIHNQIVVFNIRDLEEELRPIAMYLILQFIWNEMRVNLTKRLVVVDEAWVMMQNEDAASFLYGIAKRCRKYYTGLTTITQDITDFLTNRYGKPIVTNSSMQLLLKQSPSSIDILAETFYLTNHEKFLLLESNVGEGIFFAGTKHAAIKVIASYGEDQIITSDPKQLLEIADAKRELEEMQRM